MIRKNVFYIIITAYILSCSFSLRCCWGVNFLSGLTAACADVLGCESSGISLGCVSSTVLAAVCSVDSAINRIIISEVYKCT